MPPPRVVLHVDADAFFCQVTRLSIDPSPQKGQPPPPLAVQQEGGIIAADHAARALGVTKHCDARVAEQILRPHGGRVVSVYSEPAPPGAGGGGRVVSYRPYREMSAAMVRVLKEAAGAGVVLERASIDEAFLEPPLAADESDDNDEQQRQQRALTRGRKLADALRAAAVEKLGLVLSVGVARNKLLAKLASRAAKPDGVFVVGGGADADGPQSERALLEATPVEKLPGQGGAVARALRRRVTRTTASPGAGPSSPPSSPRLSTAADVARRFGGDPAALAAATGLDLPSASRLTSYAQGNDGGSPVVDRGPPRSLGAQHTLTPITVLSKMLPLAMRRETCPRGDVRLFLPPLPARGSDAFSKAEAEEEERGGRREQQQGRQHQQQRRRETDDDPPWLGPRVGGYTLLRHGAPGAALRLRRVLEAMCRDLLGRVLLDSRDEGGRWPRKLRASVGAMDPGLTAGARGGDGKQQQQQQQTGAPVWGPCMGHASRSGDFPPQRLAAVAVVGGGGGGAAAAAAAAPSSPERSLSVPPALLDATTTAAIALVDGLMNSRAHYGCPIIALSVTATNFEGGVGGGGGGGGNGAKQNKPQQQEIGRYFARDEAAAAAAAVGSKRSRGGGGETSSGEEESSEEEEEEEDEGALPLPSSSPSASPPPPAVLRPPPQQHHQPITLLRLPLVKPIVLHDPRALPEPPPNTRQQHQEAAPGSPAPLAADHDTAVLARAAPAARKALFFAAPPPPPPQPARPAAPPAPAGIRLTEVLSALAGGDDDDSGDDEEAERALEGALRAAKARRVLGGG
jgi:hypothetical protein